MLSVLVYKCLVGSFASCEIRLCSMKCSLPADIVEVYVINGAVSGCDPVLCASCSWSQFSFKLERSDTYTLVL
jgi:hypothetical protein